MSENQLVVSRVAGRIGAEISGVDLAEPLDEHTVAAIRAALLEHKVVFFRAQRLDHGSQIAFARQFGELTHAHPHEDAPPQDFPQILTIDPDRRAQKYGEDYRLESRKRQYSYFSGWHTDVTAAVNPPAASILRAEAVPEFGGDTQWTNLVAAYEGLSAPLQRLAETLRAVHRFRVPAGEESKLAKRVNANLLIAEHPVVRVHPETGERALFVNPGFTDHIAGLGAIESQRILELFYEHLTRPEYTVRFRWLAGDVAFWDNRATAHLAPRDLDHLHVRRTLHRVTLIGDRPVGVDGRESELIAGRPFLAESAVVAA
jgi:taurine dioxygenase